MDPITTTPSLFPGTASAPADGGEDAEPAGATVEERDAYWRKRMSGKDRAHAAAEQALRDQIASLTAAQSGTGQNGQSGSKGDPNAAEVERLRAEIAQRDALYGRKTKYPSLNGKVSDAVILASDEAELARLNALFDDSADGGTFIAPTAPRRTTAPGAKRIEDMSKDELLVALQRETTRMQEDRRAG